MDIKTEKQTKIICPTCKGNGFYRVPYSQAGEEVHAPCEDCERTGELVIDEKRQIPIIKGVII